MGEVYRARDGRLNRDVAIQVLPSSFATDPNRMARFAREAQVLAALSHTNIAAIYGLEESGAATALVMELVEGSTLAERIAAGPIPIDEALAIARQVADALEAAHGKSLLYTVPGGDRLRIMVYTAGAQPRPLHETSFPESHAQLSPDGKWVAYQSSESGADEIYVQPFPGPGAKVRISVQGGSWPRWARNGRELFFWEGVQPTTRLMTAEVAAAAQFTAGTPQALFSLAAGSTWDVAPDGKRFLVELPPMGDAAGNKMAAVTEWFEELRRRAPPKK